MLLGFFKNGKICHHNGNLFVFLTFFTSLQNIIGLFQRHTSGSHHQVFPLGHGLEEDERI